MKTNQNQARLIGALALTHLIASGSALAADCTSLPEWGPAVEYVKDSRVQYQNVGYEANWWTRNESPESHSAPFQQWTSLGDCSISNLPQVALTSPLEGALLSKNDNVVIRATASVASGTITQVAFAVDGVSAGIDSTFPYDTNWTATVGDHVITAQATDIGGVSVLSSVNISVADVVNNVPPTIDLTSPTGSTQIASGDSVVLTAQASDSDGSVGSVDFYVDDVKVGSDLFSPYEANWTATAGSHTFKATATDDANATTSTAALTLAVGDGQAGGGCAGIPAYVVGNSYNTSDEVQSNNHKYRCDVGGWCSSDAAWAYAPGSGQYWSDAWTDLGICAIGPDVAITSPSDNALLLVGKPVTVTVAASDSDGSVTAVEFFAAGTSLSVDSTSPYAASWTAVGSGEVQLKAVATDNEGNASTATVLVNVTDEALVASLTSPTSGSTVTLGKTVAIAATSSTVSGTISQVEFLVNGAVISTDTSAPYSTNWTPGSLGQYTITAKATNSTGDVATSGAASVNVIAEPAKLPHKLIGYWHNFVNPAGCPIPLRDISAQWDVIDIAFADNDRNSNGTVHFNLFAGKPGCAAIDPVQFKQDIAALIAQGRPVVLSLGGAEGNITLNTDADETNFIASLSAIVNEWGFSGLDIDLESGSNLLHGTQIQARLPRALKAIETNMGGDMYLTMAPEHPYVHGGMIAYTGIWGAYIPLINELRSTLDLLHVQLYNNGGLPNPYDANVAPEGTVDMMVASVKMLVEGFELADGSQFAPLRDDQVAIGLPSGPSSANSGQAPTQNIINALDCISIGSSCGSVVPSKAFPNIGGVMTWSINWDVHDGFNFSGPIGSKIDAMNAQ